MKFKSVLLLMSILALTACKVSNSSSGKTAYHPGANGHYLITPTVMKGECDAPDDIIVVVWKGELHNDGIHGDLDVTGTVLNTRLNGIATGEDSQIIFSGEFSGDFRQLRGEWFAAEAECEGSMTGIRI